MKFSEVKALAVQRGMKPGRAGKADLIRRMQTLEGNEACYDTGRAGACNQDGCLWRDDCVACSGGN